MVPYSRAKREHQMNQIEIIDLESLEILAETDSSETGL